MRPAWNRGLDQPVNPSWSAQDVLRRRLNYGRNHITSRDANRVTTRRNSISSRRSDNVNSLNDRTHDGTAYEHHQRLPQRRRRHNSEQSHLHHPTTSLHHSRNGSDKISNSSRSRFRERRSETDPSEKGRSSSDKSKTKSIKSVELSKTKETPTRKRNEQTSTPTEISSQANGVSKDKSTPKFISTFTKASSIQREKQTEVLSHTNSTSSSLNDNGRKRRLRLRGESTDADSSKVCCIILDSTSGSSSSSSDDETSPGPPDCEILDTILNEIHAIRPPTPPDTSGSGFDDDDDDVDVEELQLRHAALTALMKKVEEFECQNNQNHTAQESPLSDEISQGVVITGVPPPEIGRTVEAQAQLASSCTTTSPALQSTDNPIVNQSSTSSPVLTTTTGSVLNSDSSASSSNVQDKSTTTTAVMPVSQEEAASDDAAGRIDLDEDILRTKLLMDISRKRSTTKSTCASTLPSLSSVNMTLPPPSRSLPTTVTQGRPTFTTSIRPNNNNISTNNNFATTYFALHNSKPRSTSRSNNKRQEPIIRRTILNADVIRKRFANRRRVTNIMEHGDMSITISNKIKPVIINLQESTSDDEQNENDDDESESPTTTKKKRIDSLQKQRPRPSPSAAAEKIDLVKDSSLEEVPNGGPSPKKHISNNRPTSPNKTWKNQSVVGGSGSGGISSVTQVAQIPQLPPEFHASLSRLLASAKKEANRSLRAEEEAEKKRSTAEIVARLPLSMENLRHLPLQKQQEYLKLKSRLLEMEKQRLTSASSSKNVVKHHSPAAKKRKKSRGDPAQNNNKNLSVSSVSVPTPTLTPTTTPVEQNSDKDAVLVPRIEEDSAEARESSPNLTPDSQDLSNSNDLLLNNDSSNTAAVVTNITSEKETLFLREKLLRQKLLKNMKSSEVQLKLYVKEKELANTRNQALESMKTAIGSGTTFLQCKLQCQRLENNAKVLQQKLKETNDRFRARKYRMDTIKAEIESSMKYINEIKDKCQKLENECQVLGLKVKGETYQVPNTGKQDMKCKLDRLEKQSKAFTSDTSVHHNNRKSLQPTPKKLLKTVGNKSGPWKKTPSSSVKKGGLGGGTSPGGLYNADLEFDEDNVLVLPDVNFRDYVKVKKSTKKVVKEYEEYRSPLLSIAEVKKGYQELQFLGLAVQKINPAVTLCSFELRGICNAEACSFQHLYRPNPSY